MVYTHTIGNTVELREVPKALPTKPGVKALPVARLKSSGMVISVEIDWGLVTEAAMQWIIRSQAPKGLTYNPMEKVQRLSGSGLTRYLSA